MGFKRNVSTALTRFESLIEDLTDTLELQNARIEALERRLAADAPVPGLKPLPTVSEWIAANVPNHDAEHDCWNRVGNGCEDFHTTLPHDVYDALWEAAGGHSSDWKVINYNSPKERIDALAPVLVKLGKARPDPIPLPTVSEWIAANVNQYNPSFFSWFKGGWALVNRLPDDVFDALPRPQHPYPSGGDDTMQKAYNNPKKVLGETLVKLGKARPDDAK